MSGNATRGADGAGAMAPAVMVGAGTGVVVRIDGPGTGSAPAFEPRKAVAPRLAGFPRTGTGAGSLALEPRNAVEANCRCGGGSVARGSAFAGPGVVVLGRAAALEDGVGVWGRNGWLAADADAVVVGSGGRATTPGGGSVPLVLGSTDGSGSGEVCLPGGV